MTKIRKRRRIVSKSIFSPSRAGSIDKYLVANIITGLATGAGFAIAAILVKALLKYVDRKTGVMPTDIKSELYGDEILSQRSRRR